MLQYIVGRQNSWAIAAAFLMLGSAVACGDDSGSDNDTPKAGKGGAGGSSTGGKGGSDSGSTASTALQGTGDMCHSYTKPEDGKCQGWYCGVTEQQLTDAVDPKAKCGGNVPLLCEGKVTLKVGDCARSVKAANFSDTNEQLEPKVRDCVYEDADIKAAVPEDCLDCTIQVAECAADNCLTQCIAGDSENCDTCRLNAKCDQKVFACGGLPPSIKVD